MKKTILSFLAAIVMIGSASAQGFGWGAKVGMNVSSLSNSPLDAKIGMTAGVFADYQFNNWIGISADLLYARQGGRNKIDGAKYTLKSNYLNIPILANFYVLEGFALKAGLQPGFFLSAKQKTKIDGQTNSSRVKNTFNTFDLALPVGISYTFGFGLIVDARYNIGLTNVLQNTSDGKSRNGVFTISAGWRF